MSTNVHERLVFRYERLAFPALHRHTDTTLSYLYGPSWVECPYCALRALVWVWVWVWVRVFEVGCDVVCAWRAGKQHRKNTETKHSAGVDVQALEELMLTALNQPVGTPGGGGATPIPDSQEALDFVSDDDCTLAFFIHCLLFYLSAFALL